MSKIVYQQKNGRMASVRTEDFNPSDAHAKWLEKNQAKLNLTSTRSVEPELIPSMPLPTAVKVQSVPEISTNLYSGRTMENNNADASQGTTVKGLDGKVVKVNRSSSYRVTEVTKPHVDFVQATIMSFGEDLHLLMNAFKNPSALAGTALGRLITFLLIFFAISAGFAACGQKFAYNPTQSFGESVGGAVRSGVQTGVNNIPRAEAQAEQINPENQP